jgi:hypothetical protein
VVSFFPEEATKLWSDEQLIERSARRTAYTARRSRFHLSNGILFVFHPDQMSCSL